jgi:hypothetical protein
MHFQRVSTVVRLAEGEAGGIQGHRKLSCEPTDILGPEHDDQPAFDSCGICRGVLRDAWRLMDRRDDGTELISLCTTVFDINPASQRRRVVGSLHPLNALAVNF